MKIYTEEDMRKAWNTAYIDALAIDEPDYKPKFYDDFIQSVTPISLPSDEEIKQKIESLKGYVLIEKDFFERGAYWMRDKISKQMNMAQETFKEDKTFKKKSLWTKQQ